MEDIILTGDRPTGKLHLGHYVGSIKRRVELQNSGKYKEIYFEIADAQALTDNANNPDKIRENVIEVALDYLACGIDPEKSTIFIQSQVPELSELSFYFLNLVTLSRLQRNPTIKDEIKLRGFEGSIPAGFLTYPVSQAADITLFDANVIPVGDDQLPMIEQTREIVKSFNNYYGEVFTYPKELLPENKLARRLPGLDGKTKMSKSLGNCIYLSDESDVVKEKVMSMYTDPDHIKVDDPGKVEGNAVFIYLDVFAKDEHFVRYLPQFKNLDDLKNHYKAGGVGDVLIKKFLFNVIEEELTPIREKRRKLANNLDYVYKVLEEGSTKARDKAKDKIKQVRGAMKIDYFA